MVSIYFYVLLCVLTCRAVGSDIRKNDLLGLSFLLRPNLHLFHFLDGLLDECHSCR